MTLLERALAKAGNRATVDDVLGYVSMYQQAVRVITPTTLLSGEEALQALREANDDTDAVAILTAPLPGFGERVCMLLAIGIGRRVNGLAFAKRIALIARAWGADAVLAATHRNPHAIVRKYGAEIDSTNLRWSVR